MASGVSSIEVQPRQNDKENSTRSDNRRVVSPVVGFALKGLEKCWLPDFGRWSHVYHLDKQGDPNESYAPSDVFYTLNVLLGLSRVRHLPPSLDLSTIFQRTVTQLSILPVQTYAFGMALWTGAELGFEVPRPLLDRSRSLLLDTNQWRHFRAQDLGMLLCGVVGQAKRDRASWGPIADQLFEYLASQFRADSALFSDHPGGARRRFATFASQVYLTLGCYYYGEFTDNEQALEFADSCVLKLISLQGPHGEWPWLFDVQQGTIVDFYEIYTVHQYGMAPAFLEIAERRGVPGSREALIKGFRWVFGDNLLNRCMLVPEQRLSIRSQLRRGERNTKFVRVMRAFASSLFGWKAGLIAADKTELRRECRSYELAWLLWSFGQRTDLPELTAHAIFMTSARDVQEIPADLTPSLVSVIIPHLNQGDELRACLKALNEQTLDKSRYEVIVVDNGSDELPRLDPHEHPNVQVLVERSRGPGPARNRGVQAAKGDVLAFIDADCRADPNWLRNAVHSFSMAPEGTVLGGKVVIWHDPHQTASTGIEAYERIFAYRQREYIRRKGFSGTGNLVMRRTDFETVGPFGGVTIAEDIDWGERARAKGFRFCYVDDMVVAHPPRRSVRELCAKWHRHLIHSLNRERVKPHWRVRWTTWAIAVLISPIVDIFRIIRSDQISGAAERTKAIGVLVATRCYRAWAMLSLLIVERSISWNPSHKNRS